MPCGPGMVHRDGGPAEPRGRSLGECVVIGLLAARVLIGAVGVTVLIVGGWRLLRVLGVF